MVSDSYSLPYDIWQTSDISILLDSYPIAVTVWETLSKHLGWGLLCYKLYKMDTTVRNLDPHAYRALRARAVLEGRTVGELISEAIRGYLARQTVKRGGGTLRALRPEPFPQGNEEISLEIDAIVYGTQR